VLVLITGVIDHRIAERHEGRGREGERTETAAAAAVGRGGGKEEESDARPRLRACSGARLIGRDMTQRRAKIRS